jgi:hypothetical protein
MTEFHQKIDVVVKEYMDAIMAGVKSIAPDIAVVSDCETTSSEDGKFEASICDVQTEFGFVTIFPDFNKETAKAAILNRGLVRAMDLEGFDEKEINKAKVYGDLMPFTQESIDMLVLVLTEDLGLQHQKNLDDE